MGIYITIDPSPEEDLETKEGFRKWSGLKTQEILLKYLNPPSSPTLIDPYGNGKVRFVSKGDVDYVEPLVIPKYENLNPPSSPIPPSPPLEEPKDELQKPSV